MLIVKDRNCNSLNLETFHIYQYNFSSFGKSRNSNQSYRLPILAFNQSGIEFRLRSCEEYVWTIMEHEWVDVLEWIAPYIFLVFLRMFCNAQAVMKDRQKSSCKMKL